MKHLRYFPTLNGYINAKAEQKLNYPSVSVVNDDGTISVIIDKEEPTPTPEPHDYSQDYFTFEAIEDGTFSFSNDISYSIDDGTTWTDLTANTDTPTIAAGSKIMWKGNLTPQQYSGIGTFSATDNFNVYGNIMSLLYGDNFVGQSSLNDKAFAFSGLFSNNTKVVSTLNLILPATTLAIACYAHMFDGCTNLTTAPELPATALTENCYLFMFNGCTSLTTAPELPATTLADYCYSNMFQGCTSLITAPELPATTLIDYCYSNMFQGCTSLSYIKAMFITKPSTTYTNNWVSGVSPTGTFVKNSAATWSTTGPNGIPSGWTVVDV